MLLSDMSARLRGGLQKQISICLVESQICSTVRMCIVSRFFAFARAFAFAPCCIPRRSAACKPERMSRSKDSCFHWAIQSALSALIRDRDFCAFIRPSSLLVRFWMNSCFLGLSASFKNKAQFSSFEFVSIDFSNFVIFGSSMKIMFSVLESSSPSFVLIE